MRVERVCKCKRLIEYEVELKKGEITKVGKLLKLKGCEYYIEREVDRYVYKSKYKFIRELLKLIEESGKISVVDEYLLEKVFEEVL